MIRTILLIAIGGGIGSVFRYFTTVIVQKYYASVFPLATFVANILGCLLIGIIIGLLEKNQISNSNLKWFLITGFCGGFTTFSAFGYENITLLQSNNATLMLMYIGTSIIVGMFAIWLGLFITK